GYVKKSHGSVLNQMLDCENFPGLMDELHLKERKFDRGSGSEAVQACLTMPRRLIQQDLKHDEWLANPARTAREERMRNMFGESVKSRITENNRVSSFKGF
ncbi:hypothetical protein TeGR_g11663, partial [Tetraparma gracilis]